MTSSLLEISDDVNRYLNLDELATLSTVSTNSFFRGLNNMKFNRFIPKENGEEILRKLKNKEKVKLSDVKGSANLNVIDKYGDTPLHIVIDNMEMVELLKEAGAR